MVNVPVCPICSNSGRYKHWEKKPQGHNYFPVPQRPCPVCPTGRALVAAEAPTEESDKTAKAKKSRRRPRHRDNEPRRRRRP